MAILRGKLMDHDVPEGDRHFCSKFCFKSCRRLNKWLVKSGQITVGYQWEFQDPKMEVR
jgi:hypothetical protein